MIQIIFFLHESFAIIMNRICILMLSKYFALTPKRKIPSIFFYADLFNLLVYLFQIKRKNFDKTFWRMMYCSLDVVCYALLQDLEMIKKCWSNSIWQLYDEVRQSGKMVRRQLVKLAFDISFNFCQRSDMYNSPFEFNHYSRPCYWGCVFILMLSIAP